MPEKSVLNKLSVKDGDSLLIVDPPEDYVEKTFGTVPRTVKIHVGKAAAEVDVIQVFVESKKELEAKLPKLKKQLKAEGKIWVTYPKGATAAKIDVNRDVIREYGATIGLEAVAIFSVDEKWSALRMKLSS
jgi:Protein of unknown function (DUF3052)